MSNPYNPVWFALTPQKALEGHFPLQDFLNGASTQVCIRVLEQKLVSGSFCTGCTFETQYEKIFHFLLLEITCLLAFAVVANALRSQTICNKFLYEFVKFSKSN